MELAREDALFVVRCRVTEEKLLRLERGTRVLGFQNGAKKVLSIFGVIALICLVVKGLFEGMAALILSAIGGAMLLIFVAGSYAIGKGWAGTKRDIKKKKSSISSRITMRLLENLNIPDSNTTISAVCWICPV